MEMVSPVSTGARWIGIVATTRPSQARMNGFDGEFVGEWIEQMDRFLFEFEGYLLWFTRGVGLAGFNPVLG
jgi:hypothetical protein